VRVTTALPFTVRVVVVTVTPDALVVATERPTDGPPAALVAVGPAPAVDAVAAAVVAAGSA
jgi:hypothetical protein